MLDDEDEHKEIAQKKVIETPKDEKKGKDLTPKIPKGKKAKKHVTDLPEEPPKPSAIQEPHEEKTIKAKGT